MPDYIVNPNDPNTPTQLQNARQGAEELRALKSLIASMVVAALAAPTVRQSIQSASLDANGYNAAITTGAGLRPGLVASATDAYHLSYAAGFNSGKPVNMDEAISANNADILGADLPLSNTSFLYRTFGVGYGSGLVLPQYGYAFDRSRGSILNFEGADAAVITTDDFGNTWVFAGNAQLDTAQFKFGTSSLLCDGTGDSVASTSFTTMGDGSWEVSCWFRLNALPGAGARATVFYSTNGATFGIQCYLFNNAGTTRFEIYLSSNGTSNNIANGTVGANTAWALNQWHKYRLVFDALAGTYRVYISLNGAAETQDISVASTDRICTLSNRVIGSDAAGASGFNGWFDAFRFISGATKTSTETPTAAAPTITDYKYHFFSIPKMIMYEVTAASVAAGTNPTLTPVNVLYLGEADTSGVAVTAVRNYAIRGEYVSEPVIWSASNSQMSRNHNLGLRPGEHDAKIYVVTTDANWKVGSEITHSQLYNDAGTNRGGTVGVDRKTIYLNTSASGWRISDGVGDTAITISRWLIRFVAKRGW